METALHKLIRTYANSRTSLEEYRAERTAQQISVFEAAIAAVEKSLTHLPGVTDEVNNINSELSAAQQAYINNVTDIKGVNANPQVERKGEIYDLMGRRLSEIPERGVYIIDGKVYCK